VDADTPEREVLNLLESFMILTVQVRLMSRTITRCSEEIQRFSQAALKNLARDDRAPSCPDGP